MEEHKTVNFMRLLSDDSTHSTVSSDSCEYYQTEIFDLLPSIQASRPEQSRKPSEAYQDGPVPGEESVHGHLSNGPRDKAPTQPLRNMVICIQGKRSTRERRKMQISESWRRSQSINRKRIWAQIVGALAGLWPWQHTLHAIEGRFGVGVKAYFVFLRYLVRLNLLHCALICGFILGPTIFYGRSKSKPLKFGGNDSVLDFFLGSGYLDRSPVFYGFYTRGSLNLQCLNTPLLTMVGYKHTWMLGKRYSMNVSYKIFCGWDFTIQDPAAAALKRSFIRNDLKLFLEEQSFSRREAQRTLRQRVRLYLLRFFLNLVVLALLGGAFYLIYFATKTSQDEIGHNWLVSLVLEYLPPITISFVNLLLPHIFRKISSFEDYSFTTQVNATLVRSIFVKLASLGIYIFIFKTTKKPHPGQCLENLFGREMYKLCIFNFLTAFCNAFFLNYPRKLLHEKYPSSFLARLWGKQRFLVPFNVLDLVYSQTVSWIGVFYCPLLPLIEAVTLMATFYIQKFSVLRCCVAEQRMFRGSSSSVLFHFMLLLGLLMATATLGFNLYQSSCGPFGNEQSVFNVTGVCVDSLPGPAQSTLRFLASSAFALPLILAEILILTSYVSRGRANQKAIERLKDMLVMSSSDKRFLVKQHTTMLRPLASFFIRLGGSISIRPVLTGPVMAYLGSRVALRCIAPDSSLPVTYELMGGDGVLMATVTVALEGSYRCRATSGGSTAVSNSIKLTVVIAYEGSCIELSCNVTKGSHLSYIWFFNRKEVTSSTSPLFHHTGNKLVMGKVTPEHAGYYYCMAWSIVQDTRRFSSSFEVKVTVKVYVSKPRISFSISNPGASPSGNVTCWSTRGSPPVNISLLLDDKEVGSVTATESLAAWFSVAVVPGLDMGTVRCRVNTEVQKLMSEPLTLEVVPVGGDVKVEVEYLYRADSKLTAARLSCGVSRGTFPEYSWLLNDSVLPPETHRDSHIQPDPPHYALTDHRRILVLPKVGPEESGYYRCRARDSYNDSGHWVESEAVQVQVTEVFMNTIEILTIAFCCFHFVTLAVALYCIYKMFDQNQGLFCCSKESSQSILGRPELMGPSVALVKSIADFHCKLEIYPKNVTILLQLHNSNNHEGNLECVAKAQNNSDIEPTVSYTQYLKVLEPVKEAEIVVHSGPKFFEGKTLELYCKPSAGNHVSYTWLLNGLLVSPSRLRYVVDDHLLIYRTTSEDSGSYMCIATNHFNETDVFSSNSSEVVITVKDLVSIPDISFTVLKEDSHNYSAVVACQTAKGSPPVTFSLYNRTELVANTTVDDRNATFKLPLVLDRPMGWLQCQANNGDRIEYSQWIPLEVVPVGGPVTMHYDYDIGENYVVTDLRFYCKAVKGSFPRYQWFLNKTLLHGRGSFYYVVNQHPGESILLLSVGRSSAGMYHCEVSDSFDNATTISSKRLYMDKEVLNRLSVLVVAVVFGCFTALVVLVSICCCIGVIYRRRQYGEKTPLSFEMEGMMTAYEDELDLSEYNEDTDVLNTASGAEFDQASEASVDEWPQIEKEKKTLEDEPVDFELLNRVLVK
ncbi:Transmembrane channel-like protein 7 [Dissostichus eleginoides]|uniref:Transmembrane channel-like protein n=1 Tax=Dissostichus eleginoides TaxID=100907 RepID=A0AAD9BKV1_DISEL|nr:Transmembrane channel-like protein 7 [Dissostichus eleginoides]